MDTVSLPLVFLDRPCDREMIMMLRGSRHCDLEIRAMMFLLWRHFATATTPNVVIKNHTDDLIEDYVGWLGGEDEGPGFVDAALSSGFMVKVESSLGDYYSLLGFEESNQSRISNAKKGAHGRWINSYKKEGKVVAESMFELWQQRGDKAAVSAPQEEIERALLITVNLCQCGRVDPPGENEMQTVFLPRSLEIGREFSDDQLTKIYYHIMRNNRDSTVVPREARLLVKLDLLKEYLASSGDSK